MTAERQRRYRDRLRGGPARVPQPCGTPAAFKRHKKAAEEPCEPCKAAEAERQARLYQQRKRLAEPNT